MTVATHDEGYLPSLQEGCRLAKVPLEVLGWGQRFGGYAWMRNLVRERVKQLPASELVFLVDAYDVLLINTSAKELEERFLSFGKPIVLSQEGNSRSWFQDWWARRVFQTCMGTYINAGLIAGRAGSLIQLFDLWYARWTGTGEDNDQRLLSSACHDADAWFRANVAIDTHMRLFATSTCALAGGHRFAFLPKAPFLHGNGACNLDDIVLMYGLPQGRTRPSYSFKAIKHYLPFVWKEIAICIALILIVGLLL